MFMFMLIACCQDHTLSFEEFECPVHRLILACTSDFFRSLYCNSWRESSEEKSVIRFGYSIHTMRHLLQDAQTGRIDTITMDTVLELYHAADSFGVACLRSDCLEYLSKLQGTSVLGMLSRANAMGKVSLEIEGNTERLSFCCF